MDRPSPPRVSPMDRPSPPRGSLPSDGPRPQGPAVLDDRRAAARARRLEPDRRGGPAVEGGPRRRPRGEGGRPAAADLGGPPRGDEAEGPAVPRGPPRRGRHEAAE